MNERGNIFVLFLLTLYLAADGVEGRRRWSEVRTTEEIAIGCSLVGVFLVIVAVCTLYCRFCTKRKREERKLAKNAVEAAPETVAIGKKTGRGSGRGNGGSGSGGGGSEGGGGGKLSGEEEKDKPIAKDRVPVDDVTVDVPNIDISSPVNSGGKTPDGHDEIETMKDEVVKPASGNNMTSMSEIE